MTSKERELITDLRKCNFKEMDAYFKLKSEERKNMSKEAKLVCAIIVLVCICNHFQVFAYLLPQSFGSY